MSVEENHLSSSVPTLPPKGYSPQAIGFDEVWAIMLERAWVIIVCLVASILAGYAHLAKSPKIYQAATQLKVEAKKNVVNIQEVQRENARSFDVMKTMLVILQSKPLMERVAKRMKLGSDKEFLEPYKLESTSIKDVDAAIYLYGNVNPKIIPETMLVNVNVDHPNIDVAEKISKVIAEEFIMSNIDERSRNSKMVQARLIEESEEQRKKVEELEQKLQQFREVNKVASLNEGEIDNLNNRFNEIRKTRIGIETDLKEIENLQNNPERLLGVPSVQADQTVLTLQKGMADQTQNIANLTQRYKEDHPRLIKARDELASMQAALYNASMAAAIGVKARYEGLLAQEKDLEKLVLERTGRSTQYKLIQSEVDQERSILLNMKARVKEAEVTRALDFDDVVICQEGIRNGLVKPDKKKILLASVIGGVCLGLVLAFALHLLDNTVKTPDQIEQSVQLPVLTVVSEAKRWSRPQVSRTPAGDKMAPAIRESFRSLVVSLKLLGKKSESRVFLFTSALPAEGKTFCSYHCATQLAQQGGKTLLVDADLRKPYLHQLVKGSKISPGLSDVLAEQMDLFAAIMPTEVENLCFLSAGTRSPNPPKLLSSTVLAEMIETAKEKFDYIILDSAPVNAVADSLLLAQHVQHVCMIARAGVTPERALHKAIQSIYESTGATPCGVALNRYRRRRGLYYYYNYSYHRSYGEYGAYGEGKKKSGNKKEGA